MITLIFQHFTMVYKEYTTILTGTDKDGTLVLILPPTQIRLNKDAQGDITIPRPWDEHDDFVCMDASQLKEIKS